MKLAGPHYQVVLAGRARTSWPSSHALSKEQLRDLRLLLELGLGGTHYTGNTHIDLPTHAGRNFAFINRVFVRRYGQQL